jgi:hypothetical protein
MKPASLVVSIAAAVSVLTIAPLASAQDGAKTQAIPQVSPMTPAGTFGGKGQLAISSDAGLSISNTSLSGVDGSTTTIVLRPAADYFVIDNLSVGGFIGLDYTTSEGGHTTVFGIGPRVGYNIPFASMFSVWPKVGISFASTSQKFEAATDGGTTVERSTTNSAVAVNLFVPVMFHPVEHFFIGFGPALDADLSGDNKATVVAGRLTLGGWL